MSQSSKSVPSISSVSLLSGENRPDAKLSDLITYSNVRNFLIIHLVNYAHNYEALGEIPYVLHDDIAAVFYFSPGIINISEGVDNASKGKGYPCPESWLITSEDLKKWGTDVFTLYRDALSSSMVLAPAVLAPMKDLIGLPEEEGEDSFPLYVLSCRRAEYGAAAALYPEVLANIAKGFHDDLYLIPSSIHEWIVLQARTIEDPAAIEEMIHEINRTEVLPGEILSDSLYYYDAEQDELRRAFHST